MHPQKTDISRLPTSPDDAGDSPSRFSLLALLNTLLRERWMIISAGLLAAVVVTAVVLRQPRSYTASATFMPQSSSARSTAGGIASQLGISLGESGNADSPEFYANLLSSKSILSEVVSGGYHLGDRGDTTSSTFVDAMGISADSPELAEMAAIRLLRGQMTATVTPKLGTVVVTVRTPDPALSQQVVQQMLQRVSDFNQTTRRSRASAEKEFIAKRLSDIRDELRTAERRLQDFLMRNRQYQTAPPLLFEHDRLVRDVALQQQLFSTISEAYERASIEAVRDTPVITVLEEPDLPLLPDRRMLPLKAAAALVIGMLIGIVIALLRHLGTVTRGSSPDEFAEFERLRREAWRDLVAPWRPIARWRASRREAHAR